MKTATIFVATLLVFLLVVDGVVVLYACVLWTRPGENTDPVFIVGIVTFVICFTLPFMLITGFLVSAKKFFVRSGIRTHAHICGPECSVFTERVYLLSLAL